MTSLQQATGDGLPAIGYEHEILNVPLWCCTASDKIEHFEALIKCNLGALDEVCELKDFRTLIKTCIESRNLTDIIYSGGGITTVGAPLYAFMKRWNTAVDNVAAKLEFMSVRQLVDDYTNMLDLAAKKGTLFNESDVDIITQAIVLCTRDGEDFSRLFTFAGIVTYHNFHTWENMEFSHDRPRQFNIIRRGTTTLELNRLEFTHKVPYGQVTNPYIILATVPMRVSSSSSSRGSLTKLQLFYWSDTKIHLSAALTAESDWGHTCFDSGIRNADINLIDKWNKSETLKLNSDQYVGAYYVMGKQITQNPFSPLEKHRAPHVNIWSTESWTLYSRHPMVEYERIESQLEPDTGASSFVDKLVEKSDLSACLSHTDGTIELPSSWVDPRAKQFHDLDDLMIY
ncbi:putative capsid triplex subunit 1 [Crucian carp herpesvirus]|uniref:Putative capsid triplex subunit 1 n=1 Tax=Cyprinid herpesvirus 2 TaxID=317878 RepID=K7PCC2_CYHV2|nr:putative capsid triplex subunit 1 [Cyprinid herpesvirus 2]APB92913.1 putative capsid triplex subunit 1 [Crucian carp herpesvirus]AFJ20497.1 putative capsid triplex subunit 1 [Cyprinid herpesvirus 2]AKC02013.1 hypothetical protein [Cyprinid herpesvirus 2]AMB21635.1 putative capsid triplex subunit 1 [Cyprinid herpesvirus 2]QAU54789.1 putative capsid triplex subunit 1 [Cyprinid herpesvirus 2]